MKRLLLLSSMILFAAQANSAEFYPFAEDLGVFVFYPGSSAEFWPEQNLIQGPGVGFDANDPHEQLGGGDSALWVTTDPCGFPSDFIECVDGGMPVIEFDLGEDVTLDEISTWGYSDGNTNGMRSFDLRFATEADGAGNFGTSISFSPSYIVEEFSTFNASQRRSFEFGEEITARYVEMTVTDNYFDDPGDGTGVNEWGPGGDRVGIGEVAFRVPGTEVVPPPSRDFYPIDGVFASTDFTDLWPSSNLIQGPGVGFQEESPHSEIGGGEAANWVTEACEVPCDYLDTFQPPEVIIDLGEDVELNEINIWNYEPSNANGASEIQLRFATDAEGDLQFGQSISYNPTFSEIANTNSRQILEFDESVMARYVEVLITDNHFGGETPGGDRIGLSEIAFPIPISGEPMCGDFDMDGDVDAADRTIQTVGWTGAIGDGSGTSTFADGDCDGDGDVDTADQTGLIGNWTGAMAGNLTDGDDADLVYDPATGNVTIDASDTAAGQIISFVIGTDQNNMDTSATVVPFIDAGTNTDNTPFQIGQTDPLNQGAGPLVDIGNVLPTGMDLTALSEYLTIAEYASELGVGGTLDLRVVPEPSSIALAAIGLLALALRKRK